MSTVKSEILVKSTAKLDAEVKDDLTKDDKSIAEILDNEELQRGGISRCDTADNEADKKEV